jgi:hypothetical protein
MWVFFKRAPPKNQPNRFLFLEERELPVLKMLNGIWHKEMDRRASRLRFEEGDAFSGQNNVLMHSIPRGIGVVIQRDGKRLQVDLEARTCTCKRFQDNGIPCGHALTVIYTCDRAPAEFFPDYIKTTSWVATYADRNFPHIDTASSSRRTNARRRV